MWLTRLLFAAAAADVGGTDGAHEKGAGEAPRGSRIGFGGHMG